MTVRGAHFLEELDAGHDGSDAGEVLEFDSLFAAINRKSCTVLPQTPERIEAEAYQRGFAEGESKAAERYETLLREREAEFEARLEAERARWTETVANQTARLIQDEIKRCECAIGEEVARLLLPLIETRIAQRAVEEMRDLVRRLLTEEPDSRLRISGPSDLVNAMQTALGEDGLPASVSKSDDLNLRVEIDQLVVELRVAAWIDRLREVMQ